MINSIHNIPTNMGCTQKGRGQRVRPRWANWGSSLLLSLLLNASPDAAECTQVSGIVAGDTWTAANSPYCVVGDVFVVALTIQPGVVVQVDGDYEIEVAGLLEVNGACDQPVLFTPKDPVKGWKGLLFRDAVPGSYFDTAIIEGATMSGVRITNTPPAFINCVIRNNSSPDFGGGILAHPAVGQTLKLDGCIVSNNLANPIYGSGHGYGGGIYVQGSAELLHTTVVSNRTKGYYGYGAGVFAGGGNCALRNCAITGNVPGASYSDDAAGVYFDDPTTGTLEMSNCLVTSNGWAGAGAQFSGGGVLVWRGTAKLANCVVAGNTHEGLYFRSGNASVVNCTVVNNDVGHWGIYSHGATVGVTNSIVYFQYGANVGGNAVCAHSDVQGGVQPGPGNISFAPALCPANLSLIRGSPCIDTGDPDARYNDVCIEDTLCTPFSRATSRNDMGAWGGPGACQGIGPRQWCSCEAPTIAAAPAPQSSCLGQTATFCVTAVSSTAVSYQWWFKDAPMTGRTDRCLVLTNLAKSDEGEYWVVVSNACGSVTSVRAPLIVYDACVDIHMYAGMTITGQTGKTYVLKYTTDLNNNDFATWTPLATNTLGDASWFYLDMESPFSPRRYYGVKLQP